MSKVTAHGKLKITQNKDYSRFKNQQLVPVVLQEFTSLATEFPIVFVKNSETGQFVATALMGIKKEQNLFCQTKKWTSPVTPLSFSNAPFSLAQDPNQNDKVILCINEDSKLISTKSGEALFQQNGDQTEFLKQRTKTLIKSVESSQQTQAIIQKFSELGLFTPRQLTVNIGKNKEPHHIEGVYLIDEDVLNKLSDEDFTFIRSKGLLPIIYAHLISIHQIGRLVQKYNKL